MPRPSLVTSTLTGVLSFSRYHHSAWSSPAGLVLLGGHSGHTTELLSSSGPGSEEYFPLRYSA